MPSTTRPAELPSLDEIYLAEWKAGSFTSDLDMIRGELERAARGEFETVEEYLAAEAEGRLPEQAKFDPAQLARIVAFAANALDDAELIRDHAVAIQHAALALMNEAEEPADEAYYARIRAWAAECADYGTDVARTRQQQRVEEGRDDG